jgi:hypothetical protein
MSEGLITSSYDQPEAAGVPTPEELQEMVYGSGPTLSASGEVTDDGNPATAVEALMREIDTTFQPSPDVKFSTYTMPSGDE